MPAEFFIKVAVPSPLRRSFDYRPPKSGDKAHLKPGVRVQVPFGNRRLIGVVIGTSKSSDFPDGKIKAIDKILDTEPLLDQPLMQLYQWAADYYQYPIGQALQTSLPVQIRTGKAAQENQILSWQLSTAGIKSDVDSFKKAKRQQQVISLLKETTTLTSAEINAQLGFAANACLKTLLEKGLVETTVSTGQQNTRTSEDLYGEDLPLKLNSQQQKVVENIRLTFDSYNTTLLDGVTGSGKTEIYLHLIADVLKSGKQALVLVPEISLTPQTIRRFENRFNKNVVAFHSGLTDNQRLSAWLQAREGKADIIIGTRSAIFTPLARPGLIIVDEEHDASYKQQDGFRYSGRDLAIYRASQLNIPVILGTATPSFESLNNALSGRYHYHSLTERAGDACQPDFRLLDLKGEQVIEGISTSLITMIRSHLEQNKQVLIFLNRRGFSPILLCRDCGWIATCPRCDSSYTLHRNPPRLSCHHCEGQKPVPGTCQECSSTDIAPMGQGTEKTEQILGDHFPDFPVYRLDRDSTRKKDALNGILEKLDSGKPCILVGTQMLSKGHHFPAVTLVAVLDADGGLFSADFRGAEHMGQLLTQVAGRAGRGENRGEVVIQTYNSTHPTLQALITEGYGPFARNLLVERKAGNLPPFTYMALIRAEAPDRIRPETFLASLKETLTASNPQLDVLGPMPSAMEKRGGLFRFQLILEATKRSRLKVGLSTLLPVMENHPDGKKVRWSVDVDPIDFT